MRNYMIRRVGHSIFIVLGLMSLLFFATNVLGDPVELLVGEDATQEAIDALRTQYGLDRPLYIRFGDFFGSFLKGDFGGSFRFRVPASELVLQRLPNTAILAAVAWAIGMVGIPIGMLAARRPRGLMDRIVNVLSFAKTKCVGPTTLLVFGPTHLVLANKALRRYRIS